MKGIMLESLDAQELYYFLVNNGYDYNPMYHPYNVVSRNKNLGVAILDTKSGEITLRYSLNEPLRLKATLRLRSLLDVNKKPYKENVPRKELADKVREDACRRIVLAEQAERAS